MIQDITPHIYDNTYQPKQPEPECYVLCYRSREVLVKNKGGMIDFPRFADLEADYPQLYEDYIYLFTIDDKRFYLVKQVSPEVLPGFAWENVSLFRTAQPQHLAFAGITGLQLHNWYRNHRYCGHCGQEMIPDAKERMLYCKSCNIMEYPRISPAVIVGVTKGEQILMSKYAGREYTNYALLAGFVEIGESVEETIQREIMEEVGLRVKNLRYFGSQPWAFSESLLLGFFAEADGEDVITLDQEELAMADWFERTKMPVKADNLSLTNAMMMAFKDGAV